MDWEAYQSLLATTARQFRRWGRTQIDACEPHDIAMDCLLRSSGYEHREIKFRIVDALRAETSEDKRRRRKPPTRFSEDWPSANWILDACENETQTQIVTLLLRGWTRKQVATELGLNSVVLCRELQRLRTRLENG